MKVKHKKAIFVCCIGENTIKVTKCLLGKNTKREFIDLGIESISPDSGEEKIAGKLKLIIDRLGYDNNLFIISLPRNYATCRYLKVPTEQPQEIERIVFLQAPRFLPYPADELITGYQIISTDPEGYSNLNLIIVHKEAIERYLKIAQRVKIKKINITLSSYGLCHLYGYMKPQDSAAVMVIDIDINQVELAVVLKKKLLFSRYFKFNKPQPNWERLFIDEINNTHDAYLKEISSPIPEKIVLVGVGKFLPEFANILSKQTNLPIEILSYEKDIALSENVLNTIMNSGNSIANQIGLALEDIPKSLNLLPRAIKEETEKTLQRKERLKIVFFVIGIIFMWVVSIARVLGNKEKYLGQLKNELSKIAQTAKPLEDIEKRFQILENHLQNKPTSLEVLYELHQIIPAQISLLSLSYEEDSQIVLRGQTQQMNSALMLVSGLKNSAVFKDFKVKLRYATQKNTQSGEIVDFEIVCLRK